VHATLAQRRPLQLSIRYLTLRSQTSRPVLPSAPRRRPPLSRAPLHLPHSRQRRVPDPPSAATNARATESYRHKHEHSRKPTDVCTRRRVVTTCCDFSASNSSLTVCVSPSSSTDVMRSHNFILHAASNDNGNENAGIRPAQHRHTATRQRNDKAAQRTTRNTHGTLRATTVIPSLSPPPATTSLTRRPPLA
jgi:hypothetical protein